jgi:hypothetical protein
VTQLGADVDQLDELARTMDSAGHRLTGSADRMTAAVSSVVWLGPDAEGFQGWWRRDGAQRLHGASDWLRQLGASLRKQAGDQRTASEGGPVGRVSGGGPEAGGHGDPDTVNSAEDYEDFPRDEYGPFGPDGKGQPDIDDIDQRDLGDCWFLAGLGAIARDNPEFIRDQIEDNGDGTYTVTFYEKRDGQFVPVEVTVDGDFPVDGDGNPAYAQPSGKETWVMIYEKAFAELHGGYGDIEGGFGDDAMEAIYGREFDRLDVDDMSDEDLVYQLDQQPVTAGTMNPDRIGDMVLPWDRDLVETFDDLDVVDSHVYTVQGTFERDGETYVRLYNPWGHNHAELTIDEFRQVFDEVDAPHFYYDPPPPGGWQTPEPEMV